MGRLAELGPAWIASLATLIVALTGAGFFAGRVTSSPAVQPAKIVTKTVTDTPTTGQGSATPQTSLAGTAATADDGAQLGSYSFQLTNGYSAPLGPKAPTQSQIAAGGAYDISYNGAVSAGSNEKIVSLPSGVTPTYSACTTGTVFEPFASVTQGITFCIIETTGLVAGVTLTSVSTTPTYVEFNVTIWRYVT
jgi:hypothetical protein